jgi:DNA-directed RNA polymerase subunit RPC12/RpoP
VAIHYFLKVYYPKVVERRLKILRYTPRISPKTGEVMILLHESEEDTYLDDSMIADENIHSVDYDVWVDKKTGYTEIEKYLGYKHALECSECGYQTLLTLKEVIDIPPTAQKPGLLVKHFKCKYCNYRTYKELVLKKSKSLESVFMSS